jgi:hypothetical protein
MNTCIYVFRYLRESQLSWIPLQPPISGQELHVGTVISWIIEGWIKSGSIFPWPEISWRWEQQHLLYGSRIWVPHINTILMLRLRSSCHVIEQYSSIACRLESQFIFFKFNIYMCSQLNKWYRVYGTSVIVVIAKLLGLLPSQETHQLQCHGCHMRIIVRLLMLIH